VDTREDEKALLESAAFTAGTWNRWKKVGSEYDRTRGGSPTTRAVRVVSGWLRTQLAASTVRTRVRALGAVLRHRGITLGPMWHTAGRAILRQVGARL
jgi:hypothetical protein